MRDSDRSPEVERERNALLLKISLAEIEPGIWRRVWVEEMASLHELHRIIQLVFHWQDYHLYQFEVNGVRYEAPYEEADGRDSTETALAVLGLRMGDSFSYVYDFGDDWRHEIVVDDEAVVEPVDLPYLLDGERAGPPEDSGGPYGYQELLHALQRRDRGEEVDADLGERLEWLGEFDPDGFEIQDVRHALTLCAAWGCLIDELHE